jgi:hypothetical protein
MIFISDIDGTVADNRHRNWIIDGPNPDWPHYISPDQLIKDSPFPAAQHVIARIGAVTEGMFFLTARNDTLRDVTSRWLGEHYWCPDHWLGEHLIMKPVGNDETATQYKHRALKNLKAFYPGRYFVAADDDPYMWPVYYSLGILPLRAPDCWGSMFPEAANPLPPEVRWRK